MNTKGHHFINGTPCAPNSGQYFESINPSTETVIQSVARGDSTDIHTAVMAAHDAMQGPWRDLDANDRGELIRKLSDALGTAREELAQIEMQDVGKPISSARGEVDAWRKALNYNAGAADKLEGSTIPIGTDFVDFTVLEPIGVTAHIVPWNFPLGIAIRSVGPALAAGCSVVLKPAEQSPLSALRFAEIAHEVGFPKGVVNVVNGFGDEAGDALVKHPLVRGITFTGSVATGRKIMSAAASSTTPVVLELGGKNPLLIFDDADLDRAAADTISGAFGNAGQVCSSASRVLVHEDVAGAFLERLELLVAGITVGPAEEDPDIGPLASKEQHDKVLNYLELGVTEGARLVCGGGQPAGLQKGYFVEPTIFDNVSPDMKISREEIFGPVVTITRFKTEAEAIELANGLGFGLVAGIQTSNISRALKLIRKLEAGSVWINGWGMGGVQAPTGGIKDSGIGKERGIAGIRNYLHEKNVAIRL